MVPTLAAWGALVVALVVLLLIDLRFFARGREPGMREGAIWSIGWLVLSLLAIIPVVLLGDVNEGVLYATVYLIERSLSLDNLFVFLLLFSYFGVPQAHRARLLFWGIVAALALRGLAILAGVALIERFEFILYVLGVALLLLAYRVVRGVEEGVDPDRNLMVRAVRKAFPVTGEHQGSHWFVRKSGELHVTPLLLCLVAVVFADIAFAVDSIPAAFAITRDPLLIWMGNVFALLGLRALFVLVDGLRRHLRYLDETIAAVLAAIGVKLLIEDLYVIGPLASLGLVGAIFAVGIVASLVADRRDPAGAEERREQSLDGEGGASGAEREGGDQAGGDQAGGGEQPDASEEPEATSQSS